MRLISLKFQSNLQPLNLSPRERPIIRSMPHVPKRQEYVGDSLKECFIARNAPRANEETLALMEDKAWETVTGAQYHQNPLARPRS